MADQSPLIHGLLKPDAYPHAVGAIELVETHISWVLLTGEFAYKIKKPVRLDFVDFSTLARRRQACHEELRLNRRFAPEIYLDVVEIAGSPSRPTIGGAGAAIEYAVKMTQFPAEARLDRVLAAGKFGPADCDRLAAMIAESHRRASVAASATPFGEPAIVNKHVRDVLTTASQQTRGGPYEDQVKRVCDWAQSELARLAPAFERRKAAGRVRECHGDLHAENIVMMDGRAVAFDCLEFREDLRWIDCASDVAFLTMDIADRGHPWLAHRLLNAYLDENGDIEGLDVLRFYQVYRALVRAVVTTMQQPADERARGEINDRAKTYLEMAARYSVPGRQALIITHGVSGAGKSTATQELLEQLGAIRLRSDLERQRHDECAAADQDTAAERYTPAARQAVYEKLLRKAEIGLAAGYRMIVDATFLRRNHRDAFRQLAAERSVPFVILAFEADLATLRQRIAERQAVGSDASEATLAVLEQQLAEREPLGEDEGECAIAVGDGNVNVVIEQLRKKWNLE